MSSNCAQPFHGESIGGILLLALLHGLTYVFIVPPWQHYDEPSHFEFAWLLASERKLPEADAVDLNFRRELVKSMIAHDFYHELPVPDPETLTVGTKVLGLEFSQLSESPLYYVVVSIPVSLLKNYSLAIQLYGGRLVSLAFLLLAILAVWGFTRELTPPGDSLRTLIPLAAALLPGFVDLMTAVNNDVGAAMVFSWFLWGSVRLLRRGVSWRDILWVFGSALACYYTKSTVFIAIPLSVLVVALGFAGKRNQILVWIGFGLLGLVILPFVFTWSDAANWHRATVQPSPTRVKNMQAPLGEYVLQIETDFSTNSSWLRPLYQPFSASEVQNLRGKPLTFGVWMWATTENVETDLVELRTPVLDTGVNAFYETISVGTTPAFYAFHWVLPSDSNRLWITLFPTEQKTEATVYYDGFVLAEGEYPLIIEPELAESGSQGTWGGFPFHNLVKNPSGEQAWLAFRPLLDAQLSRLLPEDLRISMLLSGVLDWKQTSWYFQATGKNLLETFWGRFGWGNVYLLWPAAYSLLSGIVFGGLAGVGILLMRRYKMPENAWILLAFVLGLIWGAAILRGEVYIFAPSAFFPSARYAYPAIGPTLLLLGSGYLEWARLAGRWISIPSFVDHKMNLYIITGLVFLVLDGVAILSILTFYSITVQHLY